MTPHLANTPVIETERLHMRAPEPVDLSCARAFYRSDRSQYAGGGSATTERAAFGIFAGIVGHWPLRGYGTFAVVEKATGKTIGGVGPHYPDDWPEKELGWCIWDASAEGKGFATEAVLAARDWIYRDLGWPTIVSYIHPDNDKSIALATRIDCARDDTAATPSGKDIAPIVYRHPAPEVRP